ncbi:MAG: hypothetical protein WD793_14580 [Steroidobacteraceae bacterium]
MLAANFSALYSGTGLVVGGTNTMTFTTSFAVFTYLPAGGTAGALSAILINPQSSSAGVYGGEVVALQLNVDLSSALGNDVSLGDTRICNFAALPSLNDQTVNQFLATANWVLGGGSAAFGPSVANAVANLINTAFAGGTPSTFAQENLVAGNCPSNWSPGEMRTFSQASYGDSSTAAGALVTSRFSTVYPSGVIIGGTNTLQFTTATSVFNYLPATGIPASLTGSLTNPLSSSSGELGGELLALQLNVDLSDAGFLASAVPLGSLYFCNFTAVPQLNGQTVGQFVTTANWVLGGGGASISADVVSAVANALNNAFVDGTPSTFAQASLVAGACPANWNAGEMNTFTQVAYGDSTTAAATLLAANFGSLYGASNLVVGGTNTLRFTSASAIVTYLPATGLPAALTGSLTDPLSSSSGELGGQVVALRLNTDLSNAGAIAGVTDLGSLKICNFSATQVNNQTVDQFLATANSILGGGSASFGAGTAMAVASLINSAFVSGAPSAFAQANLFAGACPAN